MKFLVLIIFLCFDFLIASTVELTEAEQKFIKQHPVITIAGTIDSAPMLIKNFDGSLSGVDVEIADLIYKNTGLKIILESNRWATSIQKALDRKVDGISASVYNKEREHTFNTSNAYIRSTPKIYVKKGNPQNIKTLKDLKNKTTVIRKGTLAIEKVAKQLNNKIIYKDTSLEMIRAVINEEADYFIFFENIEYIVEKEGLNYIEAAFAVEKTRDIVFSVRNDWPELVSIINKGLNAISEHQKVQIRKKWFGTAVESSHGITNLKKEKLAFTEEENSYLEQKGSIRMCVDPDWMPFEAIDKDGKHIGMSADLLKIIQSNSGITLQFIPTKDWSESIEYAKQRKCDIFSLAMETPSRKIYMDFTEPYISFPFVIATKDSEIFIENIEAVFGKRVSLVKGYAYIEILKKRYPKINIVEVDNMIEGLKAVQDGDVYGHIDALATIAYTIQNEGMTDVKISGKFDDQWALSIATRNDEPILKTILQKALNTIKDDDTRQIYNKWLAIKYEDRINYTLLYEIIMLFVIVVSIGMWRYNKIRKLNIIIEKKNDELRVAKETFEQLVYGASDPILLLQDGKFISCNDAILDILKYETKEEIISLHLSDLSPEYQPDGTLSAVKADEMMQICLKDGKNRFEWMSIRSDGEEFWSEITLTKIMVDDKLLIHVIWRDITVQKKLQEQLQKVAITDQLTNLYNRHKLDEELMHQKDLSDRYNREFCVIILDIDFFKNVNDTYGHDVGDQVLTKVANILQVNTRVTDIVGRWGGEEFLIICPEIVLENAVKLAEKIRVKIEQHSFETVGSLTCSFGVSVNKQIDQKAEIVKRADNALYKAKANGRNRVECS